LILNGLLDHEIEKNIDYSHTISELKRDNFGIKTSTEDKLRIIDIIKNKCKDNSREDFEFYQAYYSSKESIQYKVSFYNSRENMKNK
jgi:hypothetical protein